jgi:ABC-2 type transport system ATP-binding protein
MALGVEVNRVSKSFGEKAVVKDLSFSVDRGELFGLIGPNGAGKTTTLRMMLDIIKPDSGDVMILGERLSEASKNRFGYLPEERGLYKKLKVIDCITYLASLKGLDRRTGRDRAMELLDRTGMRPHENEKIEELSKGMGQIIQFLATVIHEPELVVLDEPFSGLDPVNTELLKSMLAELRDRNTAVILSTHGMNDVEQLCDRVLMVDHGRSVLYGNLAEIKSRYRGNSVLVEPRGELGPVPGVVEQRSRNGLVELILDGNTTSQQVLEWLVGRGIGVERFEVATPSLNEIFLKVAGEEGGEHE